MCKIITITLGNNNHQEMMITVISVQFTCSYLTVHERSLIMATTSQSRCKCPQPAGEQKDRERTQESEWLLGPDPHAHSGAVSPCGALACGRALPRPTQGEGPTYWCDLRRRRPRQESCPSGLRRAINDVFIVLKQLVYCNFYFTQSQCYQVYMNR